MTGLHNMKLLKTKDVSRPYPIPVTYDFDNSGIVNATYAVPGVHVSIEKVTEREYMGFCLSEEYMEKAFALFIEKESELKAVIQDFNLMSSGSKKTTLKYLEGFFDIIKKPKWRDNEIVKNCRQ